MLDTTRVTEQLAKARAFAKEHGLSDQLEGQLRYLDRYAEEENDRGRTRCNLFVDFAPWAFTFQLEMRQMDGTHRSFLHGGLIYHGPGQGAGAAPEYSVSLVPQVGWAVHT